jgi:hypothetical protein
VESFRDPEGTRLFFRALANVRNFVPFLSGAKNAHHSPFLLAHRETYDLLAVDTGDEYASCRCVYSTEALDFYYEQKEESH